MRAWTFTGSLKDEDVADIAAEIDDPNDPNAPARGTSRWREWVLGRSAVRRAARDVGLEHVTVEVGPGGAPFIVGSRWGVSIAHTRGAVLAALGPAGLGVDVERADRDVSRMESALLPGERELSVSLGAVSIFVAKEAAAKATGEGLGGSLARWPIVDVELSGAAPRIGVATPSGSVITARIWEHDFYVTGLAILTDS